MEMQDLNLRVDTMKPSMDMIDLGDPGIYFHHHQTRIVGYADASW